MFLFDLKSLFRVIACISIILVVVQEPAYLLSIGLAYILLCMSPLREESLLTTMFHDVTIGFFAGLFVGILILLAGTFANADDFAWHVSLFINSSLIGGTFAFVCSLLR